jgi:hypothetical protein
MGFGIACGMMLFSLVVLVVVLLVAGMVTGVLTWPFAEQAQRFEGRGSAESVPITLEGEIGVEWSASPTTPVACRFASELRAQNDPSLSIELANTMVERSLGSGIPRELALDRRSDYYLVVDSDCDWVIRVINR